MITPCLLVASKVQRHRVQAVLMTDIPPTPLLHKISAELALPFYTLPYFDLYESQYLHHDFELLQQYSKILMNIYANIRFSVVVSFKAIFFFHWTGSLLTLDK
jgi:hypothetical protein